MRALAVAAPGHMRMLDELPLLAQLADDPSETVRQNVVEALGNYCPAGADHNCVRLRQGRALRLRTRWTQRWFWWQRGRVPTPFADPNNLAVLTLQVALADDSAAVRTQAARSLGRIGVPAAAVAPDLIALLKDANDNVRCEAAESLGKVRGNEAATVHAFDRPLLLDAAPSVKAAAAQALEAPGEKGAAGSGGSSRGLVPLCKIRTNPKGAWLAAEAIARVGSLNGAATHSLVQGLSSPDNVVRAQTAQALGTIGVSAQETAPALVEALADRNDRVRAKAVQALGKIGEGAAVVAVPSLVRALRDQDNWVSALAAEALGQMGDSGCEAVPALVRALRHINPQVRGNAAESLGKMGAAAEKARTTLESACGDEDGGVRAHAIRALGLLGPTKASWQLVLTGLQDADPHVRTAAVETMGHWSEADEAALNSLMPLLDDESDQVKIQVALVLPKLAGATPAVIEGLCRRLLEGDSVLVQCSAAQALSKLGPAAVAAGGSLLSAPAQETSGGRDRARTSHACHRNDPATRIGHRVRIRAQGRRR